MTKPNGQILMTEYSRHIYTNDLGFVPGLS